MPPKRISKNLDNIIKKGGLPTQVEIPRNLGRRIEHRKVRNALMPDVRDDIVRIYHQCDPIGFLMDVVNGKPIETVIVHRDKETGEPIVVTEYDAPAMKERIRAAEYLADKYMPRIQTVSHTHLHRIPQEGQAAEGPRNFATIINRAAEATIEGVLVDGREAGEAETTGEHGREQREAD